MIEAVEKQDQRNLLDIAEQAISISVDADPSVKKNIIADTRNHIEVGFQEPSAVFLEHVGPDGAILGFILIRNAWNLSDLYVEPTSQGQGVGQNLFLRAKFQALSISDRGYIRVNSSMNAEGFYRKLGFTSYDPEKAVPNYVIPLIYRP